MPRAVSNGDTTAAAMVGLVLLVFSPFAVLAAVVTVFAVLRQVTRHWWEIALGALGVTVALAVVAQVVSGNVLVFHFGGWFDAMAGDTSWAMAALNTAPLGIPVGILAGALYVGASERWSGGAEWHPIEQRRRAVNTERDEKRISALMRNTAAAQLCSAPPLGALRSGDLASWIENGFVVMPPGQVPAMGLLGESGSGKTVTAERLVSLWARSGRKVIFADFKGSDPELAERVVAAYKQERPDALCALWPAQPLDIWRGSPTEIANRLLQVQDFSESFYEGVAETVVRLVMEAPDVDGAGPVRDSRTFLARLNVGFLRRAYEGNTEKTDDVAAVTTDPRLLTGVRLRYSGFFAALAGRLDHGFSFEDCDLAVLSVPTLAQPKDAMAVARMVLLDFGSYCFTRKPLTGEDVTFIVDEFSAVTEAAPMVIDLAERVRQVGGQVVVSAQSYEGLGREDSERRRMRDALVPGGLIVHRLAEPEEVIKAAGTVRGMEQSFQLDPTGSTGLGTVKMAHKLRIDPDEVRQARTGEAWIVTRGRAAHLSVLRTRIDDETRDHARQLVDFARRQASKDLAAGVRPEPRDWWEVHIARPVPRAELEDPGLAELMPGPPKPKEFQPTPPRPELPPAPPDPRRLLAILAYVRAGLSVEAVGIAEVTKGIPDPAKHVERCEQKRAAAVAEAQRRTRFRQS